MTPSLPSLSTRQLLNALRHAGFENAPARGKGSHHALFKREADGRLRLIIVPERRDIPKGTLAAILKQAGIVRDDFIKLLNR